MELENFYGRKAVLELLKRRVLDCKEGYRQNLAFLGERCIGKTFLLKKFLSELDDKDIIRVYLDCEHKDLAEFYASFVGSLLYSYCRAVGLAVYDDVNLLMASAEDALPQTVRAARRIKTHLRQGKTVESYREIIALPQTFVRETDKFCVLVFDEFHQLEELGGADAFQELGKKIMTQKKCLYLLASSSAPAAGRILAERLSLLFGNFETVALEPFDLKTSQEFVQFLLGDLKMAHSLRDFLIDFTAGHPLYLKLICQEAKNLCILHKQEEIFNPLLMQALENILFHPWGLLERHFDLLISHLCLGRGNAAVASILIALASGKQRIKELVGQVGIKQGPVTVRLNRLIDSGIVVKNGNFYYIRDRLLRYWVKYVFKKRRRIIDFDPLRQRKEFQDEIKQALESFRKNFSKDLSTRIVELLHCFENESLQLNGRRYKLPVFEDITLLKIPRESGECFEAIRASTAQGGWLIVPKTETIQENDIQLIKHQSRKLSEKLKRCILISLNDLDENARIKALQERMWIWNEGELNALLNLYDKPFIMRREAEKILDL